LGLTRPGWPSYHSRPMKRHAIAIAIVVHALVGNASAADTPPPPSSPPASSGSSKLTSKPVPKGPTPKVTPAVARVRAVDTTKASFMAAVGSCPKPEDCDPASPRKNPELVTLLRNAEDAFMEACAQCATDKACEQERDKIRSGRGRFGYNVCTPPGTKPASSTTGDKKAAGDTKPAAKPTATPAPAPSK
jgi:hypothetical protein